MNRLSKKTVALIVAHPDDETLWAGGTVLRHPAWQCFIVCLCRASDTDRAPRFHIALTALKADGIMGDMDDGPEQRSLDTNELESTILELLPAKHYDLLISHNPNGEYTRHVRHEEISEAVINLWYAAKISASELWTFAYEDGNKSYYPQAVPNAPIYKKLPKRIWLKKYRVITDIYGFAPSSFEAQTTPEAESFWHFPSPHAAKNWLNNGGIPT